MLQSGGMTMEGMKLLIVDDEHEFASALAERLLLRDFDTTVANTGIDALGHINSTTFDVVLLDLKMPDMGGLEVLEKIKAHDPTVEVIILTGHGSAARDREGMERGAFDYLMKPIELSDLIIKVKQAYEKRQENKA